MNENVTCDIYSFAIMIYQVLLPSTPLFEEMHPFQFMIAISNNWRPSNPSFFLHLTKSWLKSWQTVGQRILLKDQRQKSYVRNLKKSFPWQKWLDQVCNVSWYSGFFANIFNDILQFIRSIFSQMLHHKIFKEIKIQNSSLTQQIEIIAYLCRLQEVASTFCPTSHAVFFHILICFRCTL